MTSRVQKGGPIFRPLARQKSRPTAAQNGVISRPPSVVAENSPTLPSSTAPVSQQGDNNTPTDFFSQITAGTTSVPKTVNVKTLSAVTSDFRAPPTIFSQSAVPPPPPDSSASQSAMPTQPPAPMPISMVSRDTPTNHVLHSSAIEQSPRLALGSEKSGNKRRAPAQSEIQGQGGNDINLGDSNGSQRAKARKHRTSTATAAADTDGDEEETRPIRRRKRGAKSKEIADDEFGDDRPIKRLRRGRSRKPRSPSLPPFDPNADPGENIDPTVVTMASLCSDTGQGRVSSKAQEILNNHAAWKAANRERRTRMKIMMERKKYGRPEDEDDELPTAIAASSPAPPPIAESSTSGAPSAPPSANASTTVSATANTDPDSFDYSRNLTASRFNVQVRIGPNGETVIDEESLFVDRTEGTEDDTSGYTHVIESDRSKFTNSSSYGTKLRGTRWSAEETELFYEALAQFGENYELISYVLPGRDRKSCKNKFKAEDKKNPARINYCLDNRIPVDINALSRMTGRDFSGPRPEITMPEQSEPVPPAAVQAQESQSEGATEDRPMTTLKSRKRSRSRPLEEGLMVIGDLDTFIDDN